jgi:outer membrane protein assembly factor BamB/predicted phosphodiesterase
MALALVAIAAPLAEAGPLRGQVVSGAEAAGVADVWVWFDGEARTRTDADGRFELDVADRPGIVWVRVPDGYQPGQAWRQIRGTAEPVEIALTPSRARSPLRFVHVSDAHIGKKRYGGGTFSAADVDFALDQALAHDPDDPPAFYVMTGDLTNLETRAEIDEAASVLLDRGVPFIAVPGNHDWVARGRNYKRAFGPPSYSFDAGGVHFVVLNDNWRKPPDMEFLERDLETVSGDPMVVVFVHRPPRDPFLERMDRLGVDALLTGHWHSNRYVTSGSLRQINTQAIVRGGIDFTPAGYRIITVEGGVEGGELSITHATITERPAPRITWPLESVCAPAGPLEILAAAEPRAIAGPIEVSIDGGRRIELSHRRGWVHGARLEAGLDPGVYELALHHGGASQRRVFSICGERPPARAGEWRQVQGGGEHHGRAPHIGPPLRGLWVADVGEHVLGGSPAIASGLVLVPLSDLDDGDGGGVVALDLATGAERWRAITGHSVRGTPAVSGDLAVFNDASGVVHGVELATGTERWSVDLGDRVDNTQSALISAAAVDGERAYAVTIGRLAAIDLATGEIVWEDQKIGGGLNANMSSRAAPGLADDLVIATAGWGKGGLVAFDPETGERRWQRLPKRAEGINSAPIIAGDLVLIADSWGWVRALDRRTGEPRWKHRVAPEGNALSLSVAATPALSGDVLVVPTQYHALIALTASGGRRLWRHDVGHAAVHTAHDERTAPSVTSSPIIAGDVVWLGGADGVLRAVDLTNGAAIESIDLGAPILAGPAPAGEVLVVATYDGVVRAMVGVPAPGSRRRWLMIAALIAVGFAGWWIAARRGRP